MRKSTKIITVILACAVAVCCVIVGIGSVTNSSDTTTAIFNESTVKAEETTVDSVPDTTAAPQTTDYSKLILGKWSDSVKLSEYEFFENGTFSFTYVNLESLNIPFSATAPNGIYTLDGNKLTISFSIPLTKKYEISINGDVLTMKDTEDNDVLTFQRTNVDITTPSTQAPVQETTIKQTSVGDELVGSWLNSDASVKYKFSAEGSATVSLSNAVIPVLGTSPVSGTYNGVYLTEGDDVTIQYTVNGVKVTEKYNFAVTTNSITFTDKAGKIYSFVREGTGFKPATEDDLLGIWRRGDNISGYEFKENGIVKITYVDITIPVINIPLNGTFPGAYEIDGNEITITLSVYGNSISDTYIYNISGNVLTLTNKSNNNVSTYIKK